MKLHIFLWLGLAGLFGCNTTGTTETAASATGAGAPAFSSPLLSYFPDLGPGDTLYVANDAGGIYGDTIPSELLWSELDSTLFGQIAYGPELNSLVAVARGYWLQDSLHRACLMQIEQYWWKFQYALIFDMRRDSFTGIQPLAEFYGGESGQIASVSWVFDRDGDGDPDILTRASEHFMEFLNEDSEPKEQVSEEVYIWQWADGAFQAVEPVDSAKLVKGWPVEWGW